MTSRTYQDRIKRHVASKSKPFAAAAGSSLWRGRAVRPTRPAPPRPADSLARERQAQQDMHSVRQRGRMSAGRDTAVPCRAAPCRAVPPRQSHAAEWHAGAYKQQQPKLYLAAEQQSLVYLYITHAHSRINCTAPRTFRRRRRPAWRCSSSTWFRLLLPPKSAHGTTLLLLLLPISETMVVGVGGTASTDA
jgi:hypothetical protein